MGTLFGLGHAGAVGAIGGRFQRVHIDVERSGRQQRDRVAVDLQGIARAVRIQRLFQVGDHLAQVGARRGGGQLRPQQLREMLARMRRLPLRCQVAEQCPALAVVDGAVESFLATPQRALAEQLQLQRGARAIARRRVHRRETASTGALPDKRARS